MRPWTPFFIASAVAYGPTDNDAALTPDGLPEEKFDSTLKGLEEQDIPAARDVDRARLAHEVDGSDSFVRGPEKVMAPEVRKAQTSEDSATTVRPTDSRKVIDEDDDSEFDLHIEPPPFSLNVMKNILERRRP